MRDLSYLDDVPERRQDRLWSGLSAFAARLARLVPDLPSEAPLLIHGEAGSGKTTALRAMCSLIGEQAKARPVVWFDAWRYENGAGLLASLMRSIWRGAGVDWRMDDPGKSTLEILWNEAQVVTGRMDASADPSDASQKLRDAIARTLKEWPGRPLIVIDGLDRCAPAAIASFLDGLRVVIEGNPLEGTFLVAGNRSILVEAFGSKFKELQNFDVESAFEQFFPLTISMPRMDLTGVAQLVHFNLLRLGAGPLRDEHRDALGRTFTAYSFQSPRLLKRCMNRLCLLLELEGGTIEGELLPKQQERDRALIEWLAATSRWPVLRDLMRTALASDWEELRNLLTSAPPPSLRDSRIVALLRDHESISWLSTQLFRPRGDRIAAFRDAEMRLFKFGL